MLRKLTVSGDMNCHNENRCPVLRRRVTAVRCLPLLTAIFAAFVRLLTVIQHARSSAIDMCIVYCTLEPRCASGATLHVIRTRRIHESFVYAASRLFCGHRVKSACHASSCRAPCFVIYINILYSSTAATLSHTALRSCKPLFKLASH